MEGKKRKVSPTLRAYQKLQKTKQALCAGKATKAAVKAAAVDYITKSVAKGNTKTAATATANRVLTKGCSMTSNIQKAKTKTKPPKLIESRGGR